MNDSNAEAKTVLAVPRRASRWRRVLRISFLMLLTHVAAWGVGRGQGWLATGAVEKNLDRTLTDSQALKDLLIRFEALRRLGRAQEALDARNFGIAQAQVQLACRMIRASHPTAELSSLSGALAEYQPAVTQDLAGQHQQLAGWIGQLDALLPEQHQP